jgi:hypothetical protein
MMKKIMLIIGIGGAFLVLLFVVLYLALTSSSFLKGQVLTRVGKAMGTEVVADNIDLSPLRRVVIDGLRVGPVDNPMLVGKKISCRYKLASLLGGTLNVSEVLLDGVDLNVLAKPGQSWNYAEVSSAQSQGSSQSSKSSSSRKDKSSPLKLNMKNILLKDVNFSYELRDKQGKRVSRLEMRDLNVEIPSLVTDKDVKLNWRTALSLSHQDRIEVTNAQVIGHLQTRLSDETLPENLDLELAVDALQGRIGTLDLNQHKLNVRGLVERDGHKIVVKAMRLEETRAGEVEAALELTGFAQDNFQDMRLELKVAPLSPALFDLIGQTLGDYRFGQTNASYRAEVVMVEPKVFKLTGQGSVNRAEFSSKSLGMASRQPIEISLSHQATLRLDDKQKPVSADGAADFTMKTVQGASLAALQVKLEKLLLKKPGQRAELTLSSPGMDLGALDDLLGRDSAKRVGTSSGTAGAKSGGAVPKPTGESTPAVEPAPVDLGGMPVRVNLDLRNISYKQLLLSSCKGEVRLQDNQVMLEGLEMLLNQAPIRLSGKVDLGVKGYKYELRTDLQNMLLAPVVQSFMPEQKGKVEGTLKRLETTMSGAGITRPSLEKNLQASLNLDLASVVLRDVPLFVSLADALGIEELRSPNFDTGTVRLTAKNGLATVEKAAFSGSQQQFQFSGTVNFVQALDLTTRLAVAGKLEQKVSQLGIGHLMKRNADGYAELPVAIPVGGTLAKPQVRFDFRKFVADAVKQTGRKVLESGLESLIKGEKIDKKSLLDMLKQSPAESTSQDKTAPQQTTPEPEANDKPAEKGQDAIESILKKFMR